MDRNIVVDLLEYLTNEIDIYRKKIDELNIRMEKLLSIIVGIVPLLNSCGTELDKKLMCDFRQGMYEIAGYKNKVLENQHVLDTLVHQLSDVHAIKNDFRVCWRCVREKNKPMTIDLSEQLVCNRCYGEMNE